jgi:glycerol-3-phosphate cytidylyltransferase
MKKIITYGTFDLLHHGHISLLRRARELGDHLTVALSTEEFNLIKGKKCFHTFDHRVALLDAIRYVDQVIPEVSWDQKLHDVVSRKIHTFVIGDDWTGHFDFLRPHCNVIYLPRTPDVSTTSIKQRLAAPTDLMCK